MEDSFRYGILSLEKISKYQTSLHASSYTFSEVLVTCIRAELQCVCVILPRHCSLLDF